MKYSISEALLHQFENNSESINQHPTLLPGDVVTFDMVNSPTKDGNITFTRFKNWLGRLYNYKLILGDESHNGYLEYEITGVLHPSV